MNRLLSFLAFSALLIAHAFSINPALADVDLTGKWRVVLRNDDQSIFRIETWQLVSSNDFQSIDGTVAVDSEYGGKTGEISGGFDGNLFLSTSLVGSMFNTFYTIDNQTLTATSMSGEWYESMTNGGSVTATKLKTAAISLSCQRGPTKDDDLVCTATVASGDQQSSSPSGTVNFSTQAGSFPTSSQCTLVSAGESSSTASCGISYRPTAADAAAKTTPVIFATYSGDDFFDTDSNDGVVQDIAFAPRARPNVCFATTEQPCSGVNTVLPTDLGKSGFGKVTLGYFAPATGTSQAQMDIGSLVRTAQAQLSPLTPPRNRRDVRVRVTYTLKPSDNPWYRPTVPSIIKNLQPRSGVNMGSKTATVKFGQTKQVPIKLPSPAKKVVNSAINASVPQATVRVRITLLRKGDTRPRSFFQPYIVNLLPN